MERELEPTPTPTPTRKIDRAGMTAPTRTGQRHTMADCGWMEQRSSLGEEVEDDWLCQSLSPMPQIGAMVVYTYDLESVSSRAIASRTIQ